MITFLICAIYTLALTTLYLAVSLCKPEWLERMRQWAERMLDR